VEQYHSFILSPVASFCVYLKTLFNYSGSWRDGMGWYGLVSSGEFWWTWWMNLRLTYNFGKFFSSWATGSFSRTRLYGVSLTKWLYNFVWNVALWWVVNRYGFGRRLSWPNLLSGMCCIKLPSHKNMWGFILITGTPHYESSNTAIAF
jgi:hypothetical protein